MDVDLTRADVVGTYAGLRPLIAPSDGSTVKASREHRVTSEPSGVVRIGGGKYTTYRVMARDVIDAVLGPGRARAPERHGRAPAGRGGRPGRPGPDRGRALDHRGRPRGRTGGGGTARRSPRDGGPGRRRARRRAGPGPAARRGPPVPRGGGRVGGPARAGRVARRRPGAADPAGPGAARSRCGDRTARRGDHGRRPRLGRGPAGSRGRQLPGLRASRVLGGRARGRRRTGSAAAIART